MAKKKRSRKGRKIPALATVGAVAFGLNAWDGWNGKTGGGPGVKGLLWSTLGVDNSGKFQMAQFLKNVAPPVVGSLGSAAASKFGLNRYLAKVPMFKL